MPALPANFFSRLDLQRLVSKARVLLMSTTDDEQARGLRKLLEGASYLDGVLADTTPTTHPSDKALQNPAGWTCRWMDGEFTIPTAGEPLRIGYGQQVLNDEAGHLYATGRFSLTLNGRRVVSGDRQLLHSLLVRYIEQAVDPLDEAVKETVLSRLFSEVRQADTLRAAVAQGGG